MNYLEWANSPEGKAAIKAGFERAQNMVEALHQRRQQERESSFIRWNMESHHRMVEEGLAKRCTAIDDRFTAEVPLDIGYDICDGNAGMLWVALGGHEVTDYLPPDVLANINSHLQNKEVE